MRPSANRMNRDDAIALIRDYIVGFLGPDRLDSLQKQEIDAAPLRRSA